MNDPFIRDYDADELEIAAEFLTNWLPFLTRGLCDGCSTSLQHRIHSLHRPGSASPSGDASEPSDAAAAAAAAHDGDKDNDPKSAGPRGFEQVEASGWDTDPGPPPAPGTPKVRMSWADMAQEDELGEDSARQEGGEGDGSKQKKKQTELPRDQRERIRFRSLGRKKDFICLERVKGKVVNILDGLELHTGVFSAAEQKRIVDFVYELQEKGRAKQLGEHTYSEPQKWMRGKGRVTIQFGCCYNYAMRNGNPPGILQSVISDPIPPLFKVIIRRLVRWHVLPTSCVPDSCIVNIYEPGDCIPPHIDSHDFVRPFSTVSFLSECDILFGSDLKIAGPGEFTGSTAIALPVGSVLVLNGNGADIAKHCVPAVPTKRISITFRKMDESKWPVTFTPEPDLQNILLLPNDSDATPQNNIGVKESENNQEVAESRSSKNGKKSRGRPYRLKPEPDAHESQHLPYDPEGPTQRSTRRGGSARMAQTGGDSIDRGRNSVGSRFEQKLAEQGLLGASPHRGDDNLGVERSLQQRVVDGESSGLEASREHHGRRVRLEQKQIVVSLNVKREEEPMRQGLPDEDSGGRRVRLEQKRILISRNMEGWDEPVPQGLLVEGEGSGGGRYNGRRVGVEQKRIVGSHNVEREEEPPRTGYRGAEPASSSRISVRSLNNGRRRVQLSLSDG